MTVERLTTAQMLAYFLLLLTSQLSAYPQRVGQASESVSIGALTELKNNRNGTTVENSPRLNNEDEVTRIIENAIENGILLDPITWTRNNEEFRGGIIQRGTTLHEDTNASSTLLKKRTTDNQQVQQGQQGQRRLFGDENGSSMTELIQSDGKIVFPTDDGMIGKPPKFSPGSAPVCQGSTFCERASHYPEHLVNQAMLLNDTLKLLAGVDVVSEIEQRIDVMDDVPLCVSTEQVVYPKSAENKRKEWLFVVNQDNFKQGIRIETCSNENGDCSVIDGLAEGYKTTCKQKYIYRQLAAISNDGKVAPDMFRFPSSCCCHVKFIGNPLTRIGLLGTSQRSQTPAPMSRRRK